MAVDDVEIANLALAMLGDDPITDLDQGSVPADRCRDHLQGAREFVLYAHPWKAALKLAQLSALAAVPAWGYGRAYAMPGDCLRPWYVEGQAESGGTWTVRGGEIHTDLPAPLRLEFVGRDAAVSARDPMLKKAIAIELAKRLAIGRTESETRAANLEELWNAAIREARSVSSIIGSQVRRQRTDDFERGRFGGDY